MNLFKERALRPLAAVTAASALLLAGACSDGGDTETNDDQTVEQVTYLTGFGNFGREAFAYVAVEKGYFAEENLEVDIQPGSGSIPNITQAVEGGADFAITDFTGALLAYGNENVPLDFTIVTAVLQQTVFAIIALEESGITTPQDLEGKVIGDAVGSFGPLLFPTYAELAGIDPDEVEIDNSFEPPQLPSLLATGEVDAIGQFLLGKPTIEATAEKEAVVLPFSDVLRDLYGTAVVASTQLAEEDPELVQRFNRALMRGLEYAAANPEEAGQILEEYVPEMNGEVAAQEIVLMQPYVQPLTPGAPLGSIDEQRAAQSIAILEGAGAIPAGMSPADLISFSLVPGAETQ